MGFISGPGPFVTSKTIGDLPFVQVNESFMGKFSAKEPGPLLNAVLLAVHATLMPGTFVNVNALAHLTETYKGYTIQTFDNPEGRGFLQFAKAAIDVSDRLPPDLLKLARTMTEIRLEPHLSGDTSPGAAAFGTFKRDPKTGQAYESFSDNLRGRSPAWMVVTLVGGGVYLRRGDHPRPIDASRGDCEMDDIEMRTMTALRIGADDIRRLQTSHARRGC
jgi:hypothetical protein